MKTPKQLEWTVERNEVRSSLFCGEWKKEKEITQLCRWNIRIVHVISMSHLNTRGRFTTKWFIVYIVLSGFFIFFLFFLFFVPKKIIDVQFILSNQPASQPASYIRTSTWHSTNRRRKSIQHTFHQCILRGMVQLLILVKVFLYFVCIFL